MTTPPVPTDPPPQLPASAQPSPPVQPGPPAPPVPAVRPPVEPGQRAELVPVPRPVPPPGASYTVPPAGYPGGPVQPYYRPGLPAVSPAGQPLAGFGDRLLARIIDGVIVGGIASVLLIPISLIILVVVFRAGTTVTTQRDPFGGPSDPDVVPFSVLLPFVVVTAVLFALVLLLSYLYEVETMFRSGQTIGKRVMKIKIVPLQPDGHLGRGGAAKRWLVTQASSIVPGLGLLDGLWQLWDKPYQQCLHDKVSSTLVIKLKP